MRAPVGAEGPLFGGLARGQIVGDFNLVKADAAGHGILIGDDRAERAQTPGEARHAQAARDGEGAAVVEGGKGHADDLQIRQMRGQRCRIIGMGQIDRTLMGDDVSQRHEGRVPVFRGKARVGDDHAHAAFSCLMRTALPSMKWMPHSVFSLPRQRPARGSSPGLTGLVQGAQPMDG